MGKVNMGKGFGTIIDMGKNSNIQFTIPLHTSTCVTRALGNINMHIAAKGGLKSQNTDIGNEEAAAVTGRKDLGYENVREVRRKAGRGTGIKTTKAFWRPPFIITLVT